MFAFMCVCCSAQQTHVPTYLSRKLHKGPKPRLQTSHARTLMQHGRIDDAIAELATLQSGYSGRQEST